MFNSDFDKDFHAYKKKNRSRRASIIGAIFIIDTILGWLFWFF